jgi:fatty acid desaturase
MERQAIQEKVVMVLRPALAVHQLLMQVVVAVARMAFTTTTIILAALVAVATAVTMGFQLLALQTLVAVAVETQAFTVQTGLAQMAVRVLSLSKCLIRLLLLFPAV